MVATEETGATPDGPTGTSPEPSETTSAPAPITAQPTATAVEPTEPEETVAPPTSTVEAAESAPEPTHLAPESAESAGLLETWSDNERMRHIPSVPWMIAKLDGDIRRKIERLWLPYADVPATDPRHAGIENELRSLCRALDRVAGIAHRTRGNPHPPNDLGSRIPWTVSYAVTSLSHVDQETFGRRYPVQTFERSNSEMLWAAFLSVIDHVHRLIPMIREIEPDIDEQMYEGLVQLREPMLREPLA